MSESVVVVGGGISGLAAAFTLEEQGRPYQLLEASDRWGGVIRTEQERGFLLEAGPDSILAAKPDGLELLRMLELEPVPTSPASRRLYILDRGRLHPLPEGMLLGIPTRFGPFLRSPLFSLRGKARMGLDLVKRRGSSEEDESIASFLRRRLGQEALDKLGEPLLAGIHAGDPEALSIRATFPRLVELEKRYGSLIRGLSSSSQSAGAAFVSLKGGLSELVRSLVRKIPENRRRLGARVISLARGDGGYGLGLEGGETLRARAVILAMSPPQAGALIGGLFPNASHRLLSLRLVSTATVLLGYERKACRHPLDGSGLLVPRGEGLRTNAVSFMSTKFPGRAPEGHVLLRGFLGGARDPEVLREDDRALSRAVETEMKGVLGLEGEPVLRRVFRWVKATPQLDVGHLKRVQEIENEIAGSRLFLVGSGLRVTGIPDCIGDARRFAEEAASQT